MIEETEHVFLRPGPVIGLVGAQIDDAGVNHAHRRHRRDQRGDGEPLPGGELARFGGVFVGVGNRHAAFSPTHREVSTCRTPPSQPEPGPRLRQWPLRELNSTIAGLWSHDRSIGQHGCNYQGTDRQSSPRHRCPAGAPRLRAGAVRLSGQPFPQPRAWQYFAGRAGRRHRLPHRVLAIPTGSDDLLHRGSGACGPRHLGALPAPGISLEGDRAAAARARLEHPGAHHHPYRRRAARRGAVRTRETLSAGTLRVLGGAAPFAVADVHGPRRRLGPRLRSAFTSGCG